MLWRPLRSPSGCPCWKNDGKPGLSTGLQNRCIRKFWKIRKLKGHINLERRRFGGRKAVYPADTRMLCKRYVKHTVLTSLGRIDLERTRSGAEKPPSNCPKKYCAEHAKHASKVNLNTDKCNHHDTKLQNNISLQSMLSHFDGKGSEGQN